ncbi:hypothetical protein [Haladaptatus caseinilyticus]|uniref:hypothetical protein n=1 Tax=Haladaptatus caseinilyticus TaxID=2993314 RepID=UPI00224A57BD|nr:hypothetical protein [Haladaptatus caseinilyticus]
MMCENPDNADDERLRTALTKTGRFVYRHLTALVGISIVWFVASIPLVTVGPATLGAYTAIRSLRQFECIDRGVVVERVRTNGIHATLLSALPILPALGAGLYATAALDSGTTATVLSVVCAYAALYAVLVLVPAFVSLSDGASVSAALHFGRTQVTGHPTLVLTTGLLTFVVFVATAALTVGFALLFPAVAFSLHQFVFDAEREDGRADHEATDRLRNSNGFSTEI